jgi:uncharacterized protein (DUF1697 family)
VKSAPVTYLALLRGINVGGYKRVGMSDLRDLLARLGFDDARSLLASGNLVFRGDATPVEALERRLEAETRKRLDLEADFLVRTAGEWKRVVERNPFSDEAKRDPGRLLVLFLKKAPGAAAIRSLESSIPGREVFRSDGRHAYIVYPDGVGRSRFTHTLIERTLGVRGTARNWNTVRKLGDLAAPGPRSPATASGSERASERRSARAARSPS